MAFDSVSLMKKLILSLCLILVFMISSQYSVGQALEQNSGLEKATATRNVTVFANSTSFGFCGGPSSYFCIDQLKNQVERETGYQLQSNCFAEQGQLQGFPSCSTNCFPFYMPPNAPMQSANCSAQCTQTCVITTP
jgi:hypothetical protein